jgi:hypothetical protein
MEQRPRVQSRAHVLRLARCLDRRAATRTALGIMSHDAQ